ncbi:MAG: hypothetical protein JWN70_2720 [Planctomycetaceae bacterium]|nr:hypothetical protein [Planctomycetaceae bacterium]
MPNTPAGAAILRTLQTLAFFEFFELTYTKRFSSEIPIFLPVNCLSTVAASRTDSSTHSSICCAPAFFVLVFTSALEDGRLGRRLGGMSDRMRPPHTACLRSSSFGVSGVVTEKDTTAGAANLQTLLTRAFFEFFGLAYTKCFAPKCEASFPSVG